MKVLYFTNIPSPYKVNFLNDLNKKCDVFCIFNNHSKDDIRNKNWFSEKTSFRHAFINNFDYFALNKILKENFDYIVIAYYACINGAILMSMLRHRKIKFYIAADGGFKNENDPFYKKMLRKFFISKADYYISSGNTTTEYLTYYGANPNNFYFAPLSSIYDKDIINRPLDHNSKMALRKELGFNYDKLFISVGNFITRKGYGIFLKSLLLDRHEDIQFLIVGGGPLKEGYVKFINDNNIKNVSLIDFCDKETIFKYLKMSDVFFFPSIEDIWGLVIIEAMAAGLPIISSNNVNAAKELIDNKYLYDPNNISTLSSKINEMNNLSFNELETIGQKNIKNVKPYTIDNMVKSYISIFNGEDKS